MWFKDRVVKTGKNNILSQKKAIEPVVATVLLLVVAVVAVISFQNWYSQYSSTFFTNAQTQSNAALNNPIDVEILMGDILYVVNNNPENLSVDKIELDSVNCLLTQDLISGVNRINVSNCLENSTTLTPEVVVVTKDGVYSKVVLVDSTLNSLSSQTMEGGLNQSDCDAIPYGDWIVVPGNPTLGTSNFCVMKYEAKATTASEPNLYNSASMYCGDGTDGGGGTRCQLDGSVNVTSKAESKPLTQIYQTEARQLCANLGENYQLITDAQWVTITRNAENISSNWADNTIGSQVASGGGLKRGNVGADDSASYNAASDPADRSLDTNSKAMFTLSNGETIWDISGNAWEWTNDTFDTNAQSALGQSSGTWYEWTDIMGHDDLEPLNSSFDASHGVGRVYPEVNDANPSGTVHGFLRGADWRYGETSGAFALYLRYAPPYSYYSVGFRCSYAP